MPVYTAERRWLPPGPTSLGSDESDRWRRLRLTGTVKHWLKSLRKPLAKGVRSMGVRSYRRSLRLRVLPAIEHEEVIRSFGRVQTVIDVGANVGQFAVVARRLLPGSEILSFEPIPSAARLLGRVFRGDLAFEQFSIAIADTKEVRQFHIAGADDSSSLLPLAQRQLAEFPETAPVGEIDVQVERLDDVLVGRSLAGPVLLKIDTQGSELAVLRGAGELLGQISHVLVEVSFVELYVGQATATELVRYLIEEGFELRSVYDVKLSSSSGEPIQADFAFSRQ